MADHLTFTLGAAGYGAYKYVPYGPIHEVMPYLVRRAQENSTLLGSEGTASHGPCSHFHAGRSTLCGESLMEKSGLQGSDVAARG
jgi:hypothetical protein